MVLRALTIVNLCEKFRFLRIIVRAKIYTPNRRNICNCYGLRGINVDIMSRLSPLNNGRKTCYHYVNNCVNRGTSCRQPLKVEIFVPDEVHINSS